MGRRQRAISVKEFLVSATDSNARVEQGRARLVLDRLTGMSADRALDLVRFSPAWRCETLARVLMEAIELASRRHAADAGSLVLFRGEVSNGESIVRVRRAAHGTAGWITTETSRITVHVGPAPETPTEQEDPAWMP